MKAKYIILILSLFCVFGCKPPQKTTTSVQTKEQKDIAKDISLIDDARIYEEIGRAIQTAISDRLNLSINTKIYDTEKPVDPETGKPPLKEETNIDLSKATDTQINDSTHIKRQEENKTKLQDRTKDKSKTEGKEKTEQETQMPGWQKIALGIIAVLFLALLAYLIRYLVGKFKK